MIDYPFIALCLVGFAVFMYVVLDGFGLGVGILFPFMEESEQEIALKTITPVWDGNETWLVLGGALLYAGFPKACSVLLPAIYLPLMFMLCSLVGRGVALEFRYKAERTKDRWARFFFLSSLLATFFQGTILGILVQTGNQGLDLSEHAGLILTSPFVFLCGAGLCFGYGLLGSGWLVLKTKGRFQEKVRGLSLQLYVSVLIIIMGIVLIVPVMVPRLSEMWFTSESWITSLLASIYFVMGLFAFSQTLQGSEHWPLGGAIWLFLGSYALFGYSLYPNLLPGQSYRELAAHPSALYVVVWASMIMLPILLSYMAYAYWVFGGKVDAKTSFYE